MEDVLKIKFQLNPMLYENKSMIITELTANEDHKYYLIKKKNFPTKIKCMWYRNQSPKDEITVMKSMVIKENVK